MKRVLSLIIVLMMLIQCLPVYSEQEISDINIEDNSQAPTLNDGELELDGDALSLDDSLLDDLIEDGGLALDGDLVMDDLVGTPELASNG